MLSSTITAGIALLASAVSAVPAPAGSSLVARQATLPDECSDYCSVSAGCVCIRRPTNCLATYLTQSDETCGTIVSRFSNFTAHDLLAWNPELGKECFGLRAYVPVCINVPGYEYPGAVQAGDVWTAAQGPVPVMPGIVPNCTKFEYTDAKGQPGLPAMLKENGITRATWNGWNFPTQDAGEEWAVWAQYFSCVEA